MKRQGLLQIYFGDGKGKTTAAIGQGVRCLGAGFRVVMVQFLKDQPAAELASLTQLGMTIFRGKADGGFTFTMTQEQLDLTEKIHNENFEKAWDLVEQGQCDLLILDELLDAYDLGLIDKERIEHCIANKPDSLEIVVTGHRLPDFFKERGDYQTEMKKHRHPYDLGVAARKGIEC